MDYRYVNVNIILEMLFYQIKLTTILKKLARTKCEQMKITRFKLEYVHSPSVCQSYTHLQG